LELKDYQSCIRAFEKGREVNEKDGTTYYEDFFDWYEFKALLMMSKYHEASELLDEIQREPNHMFYDESTGSLRYRLRLLRFKSGQ
jgi:hypothetical protein